MISDIIWAVVVVYSVGAGIWLAHNLVTSKSLGALEAKVDEMRAMYQGRIDILEKATVSTQRELVNTRDAVTRIENRLSPEAAGPRLARRWPGEA